MSATTSRPALRCAPVYFLVIISILINLFTLGAPIPDSSEGTLNKARDGPYNISVASGIVGALLIILGFVLCFFGVRFFRVTMFLIGFYFFANVTYVSMANAGVTSAAWLLIVSIVAGIIGGLLLVFCSRLGVAILGALALYSLGLWILGWKSGGVISSSTGRAILLGVLAVVGFILGFVREHETVIVGSAILGAFSFIAGVDFYAHTGFIEQADSFINSKSNIDNRTGTTSVSQYALLGTFIVLVLMGMAVQFHSWGTRTFRPTQETVITTEKRSGRRN
ncbi:hypothetical protein BGZ65_001166 [Modicella reniformis]|uniref:Transmembrane protein 198 n=1 Tax=Modicella reniformis TaxID=1440133 RepID=A0A9P6MM03_9FUNG|nr:hypothetical protein BGZ65_001166 [Modicella reniformis]